uniref:Uncharacterized protein n=1 Tax=Schistocephalus solidus TaxID=70667 RepID=A0A0V0J4L9_SCHSO
MAFKELQLQCLLYTKVAHFELLTVLSLFNIMAKFMYSFLFIYAVVFISYGVTELNDVNSKNGTTSDGSNGSADNTTGNGKPDTSGNATTTSGSSAFSKDQCYLIFLPLFFLAKLSQF